MLKKRILTAVALVPLVIGSVLLLETAVLAWLLLVPIILASIEWADLSGVCHWPGRILYVTLVAFMPVAALLLWQQDASGLWILWVACVWWCVTLLRMFYYRPLASQGLGVNWPRLLEGLVVLVPAWLALVELHGSTHSGPAMTLFLLILIWVADSGAFFAGRRWGRVKLAPLISPGKTREGVGGALLGALLCGLGMALLQGYSATDSLLFMLLCLVTTLFSVVGDLFESIVKRQRGVKDSGQLLPGHGGVLDRIDSLTAAAPVFVLGFLLLDIRP